MLQLGIAAALLTALAAVAGSLAAVGWPGWRCCSPASRSSSPPDAETPWRPAVGAAHAGRVRRLRSGRSGGSWLLGVMAAAALIVALVAVGRSLDGRGARPSAQPPPTTAATPYRIDDWAVCPLARPVLAASDGRSYPHGHPARPPRDADPVACYETVAQAAAAGYPEAALPAGVLEVSGVYLLPTSDRLRGQCRQAAGRLGLVVPCPALLPARSSDAPPPAMCERGYPCDDPASGFLLEVIGVPVPSGYVGNFQDRAASLAIAAARRPAAFAVACAGSARWLTLGFGGRVAACSTARPGPAPTVACCCAGGNGA